MAIRVEHVDDVAVVVAVGEFRAGNDTEELGATLMRLMVEKNKNKVLLNLERTKFLESSAIGVIAAAHGHAQDQGLHFWLCGVNQRIQNVLDIMMLGPQLREFDTCDEALAAFREL
jgi:anti-anti-sigma factor